MKKEELEKYIGDLSPEMQEKARECKTTEELQTLLAENDVELSEDALSAVAGGCSKSSVHFNKGDLVKGAVCPGCGSTLYYWDMCNSEKGYANILRMYCNNPSCSSYNNGLWYCATDEPGNFYSGYEIKKY